MAARIVMLPGLGADSRLIEPQRSLPYSIEVPAWLPPDPEENLTEYAARMAGEVDPTPPVYLAGISFGGMIAMEMARTLRPRAVILISSCSSGRLLPWHYRVAGHCTPLVPLAMYRPMKAIPSHFRSLFGALTPEQGQLFDEMLASTSPEFLRWAIQSVVLWEPTETLDFPVFHIHGERDHIIPIGCVRPSKTVPGAGHLMNVTHAEIVNRFIFDTVEQVEAKPD